MARKYIIGLLTVVLSFFSTATYAQWSLGAGASSFHGLNLPIHRYGFNVFVEIPRSPNNSFMVRAAYLLPNIAEGQSVTVNAIGTAQPSATTAMANSKTTYFAVDGGSRIYLFNDYDIGTSMYVGGYIKGIISSYKATYRMTDKTLDPSEYALSVPPYTTLDSKSGKALYSMFFSFGGSVGVKHQLPRGALMFDAGIELVSPLMDPSGILRNEIMPLSFSLNLAYRFDWY